MTARRTLAVRYLLAIAAVLAGVGAFLTTSSGTTLEASPSFVDAGMTHRRGVVHARFSILNGSWKTIEVSRIEAGCGCVVANLAQTTLSPGQRATLDVAVDTAGVPEGVMTSRVTLRPKDAAVQPLVLSTSVTVMPDFEWSPAIVDFGEVEAGAQPERQLRLSLVAPHRLDVSSVVSTDESFLATADEKAPRRGYVAVARHRPDVAPGWHSGTLVLRASSRFMSEVRIPIRSVVLTGRSPRRP